MIKHIFDIIKKVCLGLFNIFIIFGIIYLFKYIGFKGVIGYILGSAIMGIILLTNNPQILALLTLIGIRNNETRQDNYIRKEKKEDPFKVKYKK